ncbi:hypothetical protein [Dyella japonica]|uniref:Uncharacterized protein n=1 Tax=Dyella japonica A8 TaxID=1217721 RepID=A0A075K1S9_9GAMM|nr:hypothetical protein [Dyella japonica]AIF48154.1 hypothetical protein HY57_13235 [Dyella japonica A8]
MVANKKQKTPAQAQRSKIAEAIRKRGDKGTNIWLVRPPFEQKDLILNSDPAFEAFYLLEGEPDFKDIRYLPHWYEVQDVKQAWQPSKPFASVTTLAGGTLQVELAFDAAAPKGDAARELAPVDGIVTVNLHVLNSHVQRVENWRRVVPCIRRVRVHSTRSVERQILIRLNSLKRSTLGKLQAEFSDVEVGIFYGAVATLLRRRDLCANLDTHPWSTHTLVWSAEAC